MATLDLFVMDAGQVDGRSLTALDRFDLPAVIVQTADASFESVRLHNRRIPDRYGTARNAARNDGAVTGNREGPINRHTKRLPDRLEICCVASVCSVGGRGQCQLQFFQAKQRFRAGPNDRRTGQERTIDQLANLRFHQIDPVRVREVALRQRNNSGGQVEKPEHIHVFSRLWLHRIVGGNDQHRQVHSGGTSQHLANEFLMPGYIDDAQSVFAQIKLGKAQFDCDAAAFFFGKSIGIGSG